VQLEVVQVDDVGGDAVEEVAVVAHHNQRLLPPAAYAAYAAGTACKRPVASLSAYLTTAYVDLNRSYVSRTTRRAQQRGAEPACGGAWLWGVLCAPPCRCLGW
jgi:hypothetical protein